MTETNRLERWRLLLGGKNDGTGCELDGELIEMDRALEQLYANGGTGGSMPHVARWLGDIRKYFPDSMVEIMQKDAFERFDVNSLLREPDMIEAMEPNVHLVANLISLGRTIPEKTKATARMVVQKVVHQLMDKLREPMRSAIRGAINRAERNPRPKLYEMNWPATIRANLKHYQKEFKTIIPEKKIGFGHKAQKSQRNVILCIDQSGSMANSVVYSAIFGAVMASLPAVNTRLVLFDTEVVDMTEQLDDPVDVLFGVQLGGGTYINKAVGYCQGLISEPEKTVLVLISDLYEGGVEAELLQRAQQIKASGVQFVVLLALSDEGQPWYDKELAQKLVRLGIPCFACSPDRFPDLMAKAIQRQDLKGFDQS